MYTENSKAIRGTVGIEEKGGKYHIRLPRTVTEGSSRYISTKLSATIENYRGVMVKNLKE